MQCLMEHSADVNTQVTLLYRGGGCLGYGVSGTVPHGTECRC